MIIPTTDLPIRIVFVSPPPGILYCLQRTSRADCVDHMRSTGDDLVFDLTVRVSDSEEPPDFRGAFIQGPRGERHVAVLIGTLAGDAGSCWTRAAKVRLAGITRALVEEALQNSQSVLTGRFAGTAPKGGPACATLKAATDGWTCERRGSLG